MPPDPMSPDAVQHVIDVVPMDFREEFKSLPNGEYKPVHKVTLVKKGTTNQGTPMTIAEIRRNEMLWEFVEPFYARWLKKQEDPVDGTPVDVLPFLTSDQVKVLRDINIRTAEDLAQINDSTMNRIGMGARRWKEKAQSFLDAKGGSDLAQANADLKNENAQMRQEIAELREMVNDLASKSPKGRRK